MAGEWANPFQLTVLNGLIDIDVSKVSDDSPVGNMLEVDLQVTKELHSHFNDLHLCTEKDTPHRSKLPKLLATFFDKKNYIIHYRNLKQATKY